MPSAGPPCPRPVAPRLPTAAPTTPPPRPAAGRRTGRHGHAHGPERLAVGVERDGGHGPLVRVDADGDHGRPFVAGMVVRDGQSDFRSTHPSVEPHRGGCRPRSAGCQRANPTGGKSTTSQSTGTLDATGCRPHVLTAIQQVRALLGHCSNGAAHGEAYLARGQWAAGRVRARGSHLTAVSNLSARVPCEPTRSTMSPRLLIPLSCTDVVRR